MAMMFFFFNDTATTEIYTLSLHDALPICLSTGPGARPRHVGPLRVAANPSAPAVAPAAFRVKRRRDAAACSSAEIGRAHVELQSRQYLVCRLLLEKNNLLLVLHHLRIALL